MWAKLMGLRGKKRKEKSPLMITEMKIKLEDVHGGGKYCENTHTHTKKRGWDQAVDVTHLPG